MATEVVIKKSELRQRGAKIKNLVSLLNNSLDLNDPIYPYTVELEATVAEYLKMVRESYKNTQSYKEIYEVSHE